MNYLQLISNDGHGTVTGYAKDPVWAGWIPIESFQFGKTVSPPGPGGGVAHPPGGEVHEARLTALSANLTTAVLFRWVADGVKARATLQLEASAVGKEGRRVSFTDVIVTNVMMSGQYVEIDLNFGKMDFQTTLRFR